MRLGTGVGGGSLGGEMGRFEGIRSGRGVVKVCHDFTVTYEAAWE